MEPLQASLNKLTLSDPTKKLKVGVVTDHDMTLHRAKHNHPERPERQISIMNRLKDQGLLSQCELVEKLNEADDQHILQLHSQNYIDYVHNLSATYDEYKDSGYEDCYYNQHTEMAARKAIDGAKLLTDNVMSGKWDNGFGVLRPPGHHAAVYDKIEGFCVFSTVALTAKYALKAHNLKRVLIFDWDVHHGDSTQKFLYNDPNILFISLHRYDNGQFYPKRSGDIKKVGEGEAEGYNLNIPWDLDKSVSPTAGDFEYIYVFERVLLPIITSFAPELIFISAGFDSARGDPLGGLDVTPDGYAYIVRKLQMVQSKVVICLEGGYNLESIAVSSEACVRALLGEEFPLKCADKPLNIDELKAAAIPNHMGFNIATQAVTIFGKYWPVLASKELVEYESVVKGLFLTKELMCSGDPRNVIFTKEKFLKLANPFEQSIYSAVFLSKEVPEKLKDIAGYLPRCFGVENINGKDYLALENLEKDISKFSVVKIKVYPPKSQTMEELNAIISGYVVRDVKGEVIQKFSQNGTYPKPREVNSENLEVVIDIAAKPGRKKDTVTMDFSDMFGKEDKKKTKKHPQQDCFDCIKAVQKTLLADSQIGSLSVLIYANTFKILKVAVIDIEPK